MENKITEAYRWEQAAIAKLSTRIRDKLWSHACVDWADVGSMAHVKKLFQQIDDFLE